MLKCIVLIIMGLSVTQNLEVGLKQAIKENLL